jgi:serine phosphatase RsbU (regulator of sigma subunit)
VTDPGDILDLPDLAGRVLQAHEAARLGMWELDVATGRVFVDERVAAMFGVDRGPVPDSADAFFDRIHEEDRAGAEEAMRQAIRAGESLVTPYRVVWPDGSHRHLLSRGKAVVDEASRTRMLVGAITDVTDLHRQVEARSRALTTRAGLVAVAQALGAARTEEEVLDVVAGVGADLFGADGAVLALRAAEDVGRTVPRSPLRVLTRRPFPEETGAEVASLDPGVPLPMVRVACTGQALHLADRGAVLALFPEAADLDGQAGTGASAALPLSAGARLLGSLSVAWLGPRPFSREDEDLLASFATLCAQALDRVQAREAELAATKSVVSLAEALQRLSLSGPPQPDHLQIAVRYQPANESAQIGGDWYDAFTVPAGDGTCLVIGDVSGHDQTAAALMTQIRSMLRATVYALAPGVQPSAGWSPATGVTSPSQVVAQLERTMTGLQVPALTTAVVAVVSHRTSHDDAREVRWCNAGHLPPMVRRSDGSVEELREAADLLLGVHDEVSRTDHRTWLASAETLLLYTDGLVERRDEDVDTGLRRLGRLLADLGDLEVEHLADALLEHLLPGGGEDDVALVVVRPRAAVHDLPR